jgi:hypothetical protein
MVAAAREAAGNDKDVIGEPLLGGRGRDLARDPHRTRPRRSFRRGTARRAQR